MAEPSRGISVSSLEGTLESIERRLAALERRSAGELLFETAGTGLFCAFSIASGWWFLAALFGLLTVAKARRVIQRWRSGKNPVAAPSGS